MVADGKTLQQYPVNGGVPEAHINDVPDEVIGNIFINADNTTLQLANTCSKLTIKTLEKCKKYGQS